MGFVKTPDEVRQLSSRLNTISGDLIWVIYETKSDIYTRVLPQPLQPFERPFVAISVTNILSTTFSAPYHEVGIWLFAKYKDKIGIYSIATVVDEDASLIVGRTLNGYPKKMAEIDYVPEGNIIHCTAERRKTILMDLKYKHRSPLPDENLLILSNLAKAKKLYTYSFLQHPDPCGESEKLHVNLMETILRVKIDSPEYGEVKLVLNGSKFDFWNELEIVKVLGGIFCKASIEYTDAKTLEKIENTKILPYIFSNYDFFV